MNLRFFCGLVLLLTVVPRTSQAQYLENDSAVLDSLDDVPPFCRSMLDQETERGDAALTELLRQCTRATFLFQAPEDDNSGLVTLHRMHRRSTAWILSQTPDNRLLCSLWSVEFDSADWSYVTSRLGHRNSLVCVPPSSDIHGRLVVLSNFSFSETWQIVSELSPVDRSDLYYRDFMKFASAIPGRPEVSNFVSSTGDLNEFLEEHILSYGSFVADDRQELPKTGCFADPRAPICDHRDAETTWMKVDWDVSWGFLPLTERVMMTPEDGSRPCGWTLELERAWQDLGPDTPPISSASGETWTGSCEPGFSERVAIAVAYVLEQLEYWLGPLPELSGALLRYGLAAHLHRLLRS